jgi:hypothetical protein
MTTEDAGTVGYGSQPGAYAVELRESPQKTLDSPRQRTMASVVDDLEDVFLGAILHGENPAVLRMAFKTNSVHSILAFLPVAHLL